MGGAGNNVRMSGYGAGAATFDANGLITSVSDERKKDIQAVFKAGLAELMGINPILYKYKKETGFDTENTYAGFSAQNVRKYIPEAIGVDADGYYSFNDRPLVAALVNAVKELQKEIDELKIKVCLEIQQYEVSPCNDISRCVKTSGLSIRGTLRLSGEETHEYVEEKKVDEYEWKYRLKEGVRYDSDKEQFYRKETPGEANDRKNKTISEGLAQ